MLYLNMKNIRPFVNIKTKLMKTNILLIFFFFIFSFYSYSNIDTTLNSRINIIDKRLRYNETILRFTNDSLKKELFFYKVKEEYISQVLGQQTGIFSLIVGATLTLAALFSYFGFKNEVTNLEKEYQKQVLLLKDEYKNQVEILKKDQSEFKNKINQHEANIFSALGNTHTIAALIQKKNGKFVKALDLYISAAKYHFLSTEFKTKDHNSIIINKNIYLYTISNISEAILVLKTIVTNLENKKLVAKIIDRLFSNIDIIMKKGNPELNNLCSECRMTLQNFTKDISLNPLI
jgi:hypothetical protein